MCSFRFFEVLRNNWVIFLSFPVVLRSVLVFFLLRCWFFWFFKEKVSVFLAMLGRYWKYLGEKSNRLILVDSSELFLEHWGVYFPLFWCVCGSTGAEVVYGGSLCGFSGVVFLLVFLKFWEVFRGSL